jgi:hypothetical protein
MKVWLKALSPLYSPLSRKIVLACIFGSILVSPVGGRWTSYLSRFAADPAKFCRTALGQWSESKGIGQFFCGEAKMDDAPLPQRAQFKKRNLPKDSSSAISNQVGGVDAHSCGSNQCDTDPPKSQDLKDAAYSSHGGADVKVSRPSVVDPTHNAAATHRPCSPSSTAHTRFPLAARPAT